METYELDVRRLLCPMPVIKTQNKLKEINPGDQIKVICTDPGTKADIPAWCRIHGHKVTEIVEENDEYIFTVVCGPNDG